MRGVLLLILTGFGAAAMRANPDGHAPVPSDSPPAAAAAGTTHKLKPDEIDSLLRIAETKTSSGDYATAEIALRQLMAAPPDPERDHRTLLALARLHRQRGEGTRAVAIYERLLRDTPHLGNHAPIYIELARTLRSLGAFDLAIGRFYSVINATLNAPAEGDIDYRQLARTAQFEVAETHLIAGRNDEAARLFDRLILLDLTAEDRHRARFHCAQAHARAGRPESAVAALAPALDPKAGETALPEALHLQATLLLQLGRRAEALTAVERLLSAEYAQRDENPERWRSWQRVTGNQLANEFYEQGDAASALAIYRTLATLDARAEWRLAITYQIGLCLERLSTMDDTIKSYREIVEAGNQPAASAQVTDLARMASWRVRHLQWRSRATTQWQELSQGAVDAPPPAPSPRADASPTS